RGRIAVQVGGLRIVCMDDLGPHCEPDAKHSTVNAVMTRLTAGGHHLTLALMESSAEPKEREQLCWDVELADAKKDSHYLFRELVQASDVLWISGAQSMRSFLRRMWDMYDRIPPIVYETEELTDGEDQERIAEENALCEAADIVVVSNDHARQVLRERGIPDVRISRPEELDNLLLDAGAGIEF